MITCSQARYIDFLDFLDAKGVATPPAEFMHVAVQVSGKPAWVFRVPSGPPVAIAGIFPTSTEAELWFFAGPEANENMMTIIRSVRRHVSLARQCLTVPVVARVHPLNEAGERMARMVGLERTSQRDGVSRIWSC